MTNRIGRRVETGLILLLVFLLMHPDVSMAGTYLELDPGASKKADADATLGAPVKEVEKDARYDYPPQPDTRRISITFDKNTRVIQGIEIYPQESFPKNQYREWFHLGKPDRAIRDKRGNLVEVYNAAGITLYFAGVDENSPVEYFSHFNPAPQVVRAPSLGNPEERRYIEDSDRAQKGKDWSRAKQLIDEGLGKYPDSAGLWHSRALYYFGNSLEPAETRPKEAQRSMERAYQLDPSGKHAAELGWLCRELQGDCNRALYYFEEADRKGQAKKDPALYYWMGRCCEDIGQYDKARVHYDRFIAASPDHELSRDAKDRLRSPATSIPGLKPVLNLTNATEVWAKEWTVTASATTIANDGAFGFYPTAGRRGDANPNPGRVGVLYVHPPQRGVPAKIERRVRLGSKPVLGLGVSGNRNVDGNWDLVVKVDGRNVGERRSIEGRHGWQDVAYDLSPYANRAVTLTIEVISTNWHYEYAFFDYIELR